MYSSAEACPPIAIVAKDLFQKGLRLQVQDNQARQTCATTCQKTCQHDVLSVLLEFCAKLALQQKTPAANHLPTCNCKTMSKHDKIMPKHDKYMPTSNKLMPKYNGSSEQRGSPTEPFSETSTRNPRSRNPKGVAAKAWRPDSFSSRALFFFLQDSFTRLWGPAGNSRLSPVRPRSFKESISMSSIPWEGRLEEFSFPRPLDLPLKAHQAR